MAASRPPVPALSRAAMAMPAPLFLLADVLVLLMAPALAHLSEGRPFAEALVTDASRYAVAGLVLLHVLPHAWSDLGLLAPLLFVGGALGVALAERALPTVAMAPVAAVALLAHHLADGAALAVSSVSPALGVAVVAHALPIGLVGFRLGRTFAGGAAVVGGLVVATGLGFWLASTGMAVTVTPAASAIATALGGGLLHAVFHLSPSRPDPVARWLAAAIAAIIVIGLLIASPP